MDKQFATLTRQQAEFVRRLGVDEGYTWRAIAQACYEAWDVARDPPDWWSIPSNQYIGMLLCKAAAEQFGEDHTSGPWW